MPLLTELDVLLGLSNYKDAALLALSDRGCVRSTSRSRWPAGGHFENKDAAAIAQALRLGLGDPSRTPLQR
jgi:hypothetical protein